MLVQAAMDALASFCASKKTLHLVINKVPPEKLKKLSDEELPPSYLRFLSVWGTFHVSCGTPFAEEGHECLKLFEADQLGSAALDDAWGDAGEVAIAFQYINDDAVDDFYCFNPTIDLGDGEYAVGRAHHDEPLAWDHVGFEEHLAYRIEEFMEQYAEEE
ncbi:hypothetical protein ACIGXA_33470 [Streptomyces fildesensis]|uniref:Knr4/Smi1-like domain-containing protein n=1 Tax=Streptomyces fildesensis TaxID=375757 RepID=A0ABW8CG45_9ACTN